ncbi:Wadjet anti-phage system protein JetA family protein [Konateibacter massiliensis]|uniref:Wadjet anti-phage system protein JetA family protein n=1 Tax=Konateibacter massiliensis TaxID=2002841 RepID=UPI000C161E76|nr:Wadjet anti-phage system protein JetA family protein [Konateibacter massiliensis]
MKGIYNIPEQFFSLFKSRNRYIYIESLLLIYEEYLYNDYFLSKETCVQLLADCFSNRLVDISADDTEEDTDKSEPVATRIFTKLVKFGWLRKIEDYKAFKTNVVIPDYASIFIETFQKLDNPEADETDLYIQNVYTNLYSFYYDNKAGMELLRAAMVNTARLNRALQDMLHNMDKFFETLLKQESYEELLQEHLNGYVNNIVNKKYALLKTGDNFYIYKNDIKTLLNKIREDEERQALLKKKLLLGGKAEEETDNELFDILDHVERGIANMERRIAHIDSEHSKYVRATVRRLEYMLNNDDNVKGNVVKLLGMMNERRKDKILNKLGDAILINDFTVLSKDAMYQKRGPRKNFEDTIEGEANQEKDLTAEEILRLNRNKNRYSKKEIEHFILDKMEAGEYTTNEQSVQTQEEFELLILAYDHSIRKKSPYSVRRDEYELIQNEKFSYPRLTFERKAETEEKNDTIL